MNLNKLKRKLIDLYKIHQETSDECYAAFDEFINEVYKQNNTSQEEVDKFQEKTKNYVINGYLNELITILEMCDTSTYEFNLYLDKFIDVVSLYSCAIAIGKKQ